MGMSGNQKPFSHYAIEWFLASIECEEFTNASYFKRVIKEHFYKKMRPISNCLFVGGRSP